MELLKEFAKLGLDVGALTALIIVIIKLLDMNKNILDANQNTIAVVSENTKVMTSIKGSVDANTKVTHEIVDHFKAKKCLLTP